MVESITLIGQAVAIIAACWAIISGVGAWKREFIGKRRVELAEATLASFFEVKDAISMIRSPVSSSTEGSTRVKGDNESPEETELLNRGHIVFERYESNKDAFLKFDTLQYKFMAAYGQDSEDIFKETRKIIHSIFFSARQLATYYWKRQGRIKMSDKEFKKHLKEMQAHEGVFWDTWSDDDVIRVKLSTVQKKLDNIVAPTFEEPIGLYSLLTKRFGRD
ncbi:hypothetical protein [Shewanella sp. MBTL60-007]|uniref:hypothetical protein n=1 Tax=Shewanella sp. MBTL60-007 TaxID=2815911 RepID=UPI001BBBAB0A|nr:hypothetical protein [Shewanella sp. MBTL60-007]GIU29988.1 hypothetical protein TUM3792_40310 [Shewanella sp. MBTL60-007]